MNTSDMQYTARTRVTLTHKPDAEEDVGTLLDAAAKKLQFNAARPMSYADARDQALRENPELARKWLAGHEG